MNDFNAPRLSPVHMIVMMTETHAELGSQVIIDGKPEAPTLCATIAVDLLSDPAVAHQFSELSRAIGNYLHQRIYPGEPVTGVVDLTTATKKEHLQ